MTGEQRAGRLTLRPTTDPDMWDQLVAKHSDATPFHRADLLATMGSALGLEVHLTVAEIDGEDVGAVPMLVRGRGPFLTVNRALPLPYLGPLLPPECSLDAVLAAARAYLRPRVVVQFELQSVSPFSVPDGLGWQYDDSYSSAISPVPDTDDEGLLATLSKNQRAHARRSRRRGLVAGPATRQEIADHLAAWSDAPLLRQGLPPRWPDGALLAVYDALPRDVCMAMAARDDGEVVGVSLALCFAGRMVGWVMGVSEEGRSGHAATLLHVAELGLARDRGISELDVLGASTPNQLSYKRSLGAVFRPRGVACWEAPLVGGLRLARRATALLPTRAAR